MGLSLRSNSAETVDAFNSGHQTKALEWLCRADGRGGTGEANRATWKGKIFPDSCEVAIEEICRRGKVCRRDEAMASRTDKSLEHEFFWNAAQVVAGFRREWFLLEGVILVAVEIGFVLRGSGFIVVWQG